MLYGWRLIALVILALGPVAARTDATWILAKSEHFELYSQAGSESTKAALVWFETLRAFFAQRTGARLEGRPLIRAIAFRSPSDYQQYRLRPNADAYYVSLNDRDYIVLPMLKDGAFPLAAHEFAHLALHASGIQLPPWLSEGLAEFYSTLQISEIRTALGGEQPRHALLLKKDNWIPLAHLLNLTTESLLHDSRSQNSLFYAQSWALTEMLVLSPDYSARFDQLRTALASGTSSLNALTATYGKPATVIEADLRAWIHKPRPSQLSLPGVTVGNIDVQLSAVDSFESQALIAELLLVSGEVDRAQALYRTLLAENPQTAVSYAALGSIALRKGDRENARAMWKKAMELQIADAALCYRYAALAEEAGLPADEVRPALQRALDLQPNLDDARYSLALLESNAGHYEIALAHWTAIQHLPPARSYDYWSSVANAYNELGRREEAQAAAQQALVHARNSTQMAHARQLTFIARTDVAVQFSSDASGHTRMVTTRAPHGATNWNPFIEPGDDLRRVEAKITAIDCTGQSIQILVATATGNLKLTIRDVSRVQMRNAPSEFTCGPQPASPIVLEYAATTTSAEKLDGIVRGIQCQ